MRLWFTVMVVSHCADAAEDNEVRAPAFCAESPITPRIFLGTSAETYLGLSARQQTAVGMVFPQWADNVNGPVTGCTGTVIAPGWVLTASHCIVPKETVMGFAAYDAQGNELAKGWSRHIVEHDTLDLALIELDADTTQLAATTGYIPIVDGPSLQPGQQMVLSGLGFTETNLNGNRRFVVETILALSDDLITMEGYRRSGACTGESGGPLLMRSGDGTVRIAGVLSAGSESCLDEDYYIRISVDRPFFTEHVPLSCLPTECGEMDHMGRCYASIAVWCENAHISGDSCEQGEVCGWSCEYQGYRCVPDTTTVCSGFDNFGRCSSNIAEHCDHGILKQTDCGDDFLSCILDEEGHAVCR